VTKKQKKVLVVDDDPMLREMLDTMLAGNGYTVETAANGVEALAKAEAGLFDHIISDIGMPEMDGLALLQHLQDKKIRASVIMLSAFSDMEHVKHAMQLGASDYLTKPLQSVDDLLLTLKRVTEKEALRAENRRLRQEVTNEYSFANIVAKSKKMNAIFHTIAKIADYKTTVLVTGESGTGKELIAKAIHYNSVRKDGPLVSVNCGGIPETLLESELFGHVKGAFTDAYRSKKGLFEEADGGTLFLDEMGELPTSLQVKILRALQEEEIRPLGDTTSIKVDVRIISATAKNLREEVTHKRFREDLFYRVNVLTIEVPPLRERKEDIPLLVEHFIQKYNKRLNLRIHGVGPETMQRFMDYSWPGNVRELENVIERCMALAEGDELLPNNLPPELLRAAQSGEPAFDEGFSIKQNSIILEKRLIEKALAETNGNKTKAASLLEISLPTLFYKIKEFGIGQAAS
jgi:two-component system response regulator AtoC